MRGLVRLDMCLKLSLGQNAHRGAIATTSLESHNAIGEGIQRIVLTHSYILTGIVTCTTLANDDVAGNALLTTKNLNT